MDIRWGTGIDDLVVRKARLMAIIDAARARGVASPECVISVSGRPIQADTVDSLDLARLDSRGLRSEIVVGDEIERP